MLLVTGATGFIGRPLLKALLKKGYRIKILCMDGEDVASLPRQVSIARGDITKPETLRDVCKGSDAVIHLAGIVSYTKPRDVIFKINTEGTKNLLDECKASGVRKFIFSSSVSVYGKMKGEADEASPMDPRNPYGESKAAAERLVAGSGLQHVILRIAPIYGAGSPNWKKNLGMLERGFPLPKTSSVTHVVHISDAVQAFVKAVGKGSGVYNIADKAPMPFTEFAETLVRLLGKKPRKLPCFIVSLIAAASGMKGYLDVLAMNRAYSIRKAEKELGFVPSADFPAEAKRMIAWYNGLP